jgi:hypothetical protein
MRKAAPPVRLELTTARRPKTMREPLLNRSPEPGSDPQDDHISLYFSASTVATRALPVLALIGYGDYSRGQHWILWVGVVALALGLLGPRRLDLDTTTLTLVPILRVMPRQRFQFTSLDHFERNTSFWYRTSPYGIIKAAILGGHRYRTLGLHPTRTLTLTAVWAPSYTKPALGAQELTALLEERRQAAYRAAIQGAHTANPTVEHFSPILKLP